MNVPVHIFGTLPLIHIKAGSGGKKHGGLKIVQFGKGTIAFTYEGGMNVSIIRQKSGVVRRRSHIFYIDASGFKGIAYRFKNIPVTLAVAENNIFMLFFFSLSTSAGKKNLKF